MVFFFLVWVEFFLFVYSSFYLLPDVGWWPVLANKIEVGLQEVGVAPRHIYWENDGHPKMALRGLQSTHARGECRQITLTLSAELPDITHDRIKADLLRGWAEDLGHHFISKTRRYCSGYGRPLPWSMAIGNWRGFKGAWGDATEGSRCECAF